MRGHPNVGIILIDEDLKVTKDGLRIDDCGFMVKVRFVKDLNHSGFAEDRVNTLHTISINRSGEVKVSFTPPKSDSLPSLSCAKL